MPFDDHKNLAYSTVATVPSPASSGTSLVVDAGHGTRFPAVPFNAAIWPVSAMPTPANAEIVRVTAIATDTLTIVRAQEGTTARSVVVGDQIAATITDKVLTDIERDPKNFSYCSDDFVTGDNVSRTIGALGWVVAAGTTTQQAPVADHPGIIRRATSATINTLASIESRANASGIVLLPEDDFETTWIIRLNTNDANTRVHLGLMDQVQGLGFTNGIYIEKEPADTDWFAVTESGGVQTRTSLGAVGTGWVRFRIRRKDASTISFRMDDGTEVDHTTNIPTAAMSWGAHIMTTAAADKTMDIDFADLLITGLTR